MKKVLILVLVVVISLIGCTNNGTGKNGSTSSSVPTSSNFSPDPSNYPAGIHSDIILPENPGFVNSLNIIYPAYNIMKYLNLDEWHTLIKDKFDMDLNITYEYIEPKDLYGSNNPNSILYLNFTRGVPYEFNTNVFLYSDDNIVYDLSPYYLKYGWDKFIDPAYIELLKVEGKIFAVPASNEKYILPRYYNESFITELGLDVPTTTSEFYEYLSSTKKLNQGNSEFYPMCVFDPYITKSTADIFRAFGVYFNSCFNLTITYNPNTNSFEDGVFSEGAEDALNFIRTLQDENLMAICGDSSYRNSEGIGVIISRPSYEKLDKNFATEYGVLYVPEKFGFIRQGIADVNKPAYNSVEGYYLIGTNDKNICEVKSDLAFYMFPKTNDKINETVETFNKFFTSSEYYANLRYGVDEKDFTIIDYNIVINRPSVGSFVDLKAIKSFNDFNTTLVPESRQVIEGLSMDTYFEKNVFNQYYAYLGNGTKFDANSQGMMIDILFDESLSPYDAIDEYKKMFTVSGLQNVINEMNMNLGTPTSYDYNIF